MKERKKRGGREEGIHEVVDMKGKDSEAEIVARLGENERKRSLSKTRGKKWKTCGQAKKTEH